jgi:predicted naringenin-chalcone synthase
MGQLMPDPLPRVVSVGRAHPQRAYTQQDLIDLFRCDDPRITRFFTSSHIQQRYLVLPDPELDGSVPEENGTELLDKHLRVSLEIGSDAIHRCLDNTSFDPDQIDYLATVTSTGFLCPGLSAYLAEEMGMRRNIHRADIVGMGCNAGMNGLFATAQYAASNTGSPALLLSSEICSAAYVFDMTVRTGVVNSLFGDASAAALVLADENLGADHGPGFVDWETLVLHEARDEMRFFFEEGKFSFYLGWEIPYLIGDNIRTPVFALLERNGLKRRDIAHWIVHSGGKKVVDAIRYNIGLSEHDVRHTRSVLRGYGNISSASILFSLDELAQEGVAREGDLGVIIAMGPGVTIETGLLRW